MRREDPAADPSARTRAFPGTGVATGCLAISLFLAPLIVDPSAGAAFDAPKRLLALVSIVAAAAVLSGGGIRAPRNWTGSLAGRIALMAAAVVGLGVVAALTSPRPAIALDATRAALLYALLPLIGASAALEGPRRLLLPAAFVASSLVNAVASILQAGGRVTLYAVEERSGRQDTGAFLGNEGHLAIALALASILALAGLVRPGRRGLRVAAAVALPVFAWALLLNRSLTALSAVVAGALIFVLLERRRLVLPLLIVATATAGAAVALAPPVRERAIAAVADARAGEWDRLLTYRLGPWASALEMIRARPLFGFGPGTFEAEFVPHRLSAEIRFRTRFLNPTTTSSYGEAHSDYLQLGAEMGVLALLLGLSALFALLAGTIRAGLRDGPAAAEARLLGALLVTGAVMALTWFPLQQTPSLLVLGLAAGRAWAILAGDSARSSGDAGRTPRVALVLLLAAGLVPEATRYRAERRLGLATSQLRDVLAGESVNPSDERLSRVADLAREAAAGLPGDSRPLVVAGSARLLSRQPEQAIEAYRAGHRHGERAEIDFNLGRAHMMLRQRPEAERALLRSAWISPPLLAGLPENVALILRGEVTRLESLLARGELKAPPP